MANTVIIAETFSSEVQKRLNDDNSVLSLMRSANAFLDGYGKTVHIPNAATPSTITINGVIPAGGADVEDYTHTDVTLTLDVARIAPISGLNFEAMTNSYDAFKAQTDVNIDAIVERACDQVIYKVVADADKTNYIVSTTGSAGVGNGPAGSNKKKLTLADLRSAQLKLNKAKVKKDGRVLLINSQMLAELQEDTTVATMLSNTELGVQKLIAGAIGMLAGFIIVERSWTGALSGTTAQAITVSETSAMTYSAIAFQRDSVFQASSVPKVFPEENNPQYYGNVISAEVAFGAIIPRTDKKGVVIINGVA